MTSLRHRVLAGFTAMALLGAPAAALAQSQPTQLGQFSTWYAWKGADENGAICYVNSSPQDQQPKEVGGKPVNRDPASFLIIHRDKAPSVNPDGTPAKDASGKQVFRKVRNEVQMQPGYPMQPTTDSFSHTAEIDGKAYPMKSVPDDPATSINDAKAAWLSSMDAEAGFVAALKKGTKLVVKGTSARGTQTTDTYSLAGVTAAIAAIDKACP